MWRLLSLCALDALGVTSVPLGCKPGPSRCRAGWSESSSSPARSLRTAAHAALYRRGGISGVGASPSSRQGNVSQRILALGEAMACTGSGPPEPRPLERSVLGKDADADECRGLSERSECFLSEMDDCKFSWMPRGATTLVYPGGLTRCMSSDHPQYAFSVSPGDSDKLLIFFQSGGASWSKESLILSSQGIWLCTDGIFDRTRKDNPFKNYTFVTVSYCSGDLGGGDVEQTWKDSNGQNIEQRGYQNTKSVIYWVLDNFPRVASLVLSGSSAGALGLQWWSRYILEQFEGRYTQAFVILDSFVGVNPQGEEKAVMEIWNTCGTGVLPEFYQQQCDNGTLAVGEMFYSVIKSFPDVRFAHVNSKTDMIQILFWDAWSDLNDPSIRNTEGVQYLAQANKIFWMNSQLPNYVSYLVNGAWHIFLQSNELYTAGPAGEKDRVSAKPALVDWLSDFLQEGALGSVCLGARYDKSQWESGSKGALFCDAVQAKKKLEEPAAGPADDPGSSTEYFS